MENGRYPENESILLKLPMALPYPVYAAGWQKMQEEFEYKGSYYKGIKQRLERDTLYIICFKDQQKSHVAHTLTKYAKDVNDLPTEKKNHAALAKYFSDYVSSVTAQLIRQCGWCHQFSYCDIQPYIHEQELPVLSPPPRI